LRVRFYKHSAPDGAKANKAFKLKLFSPEERTKPFWLDLNKDLQNTYEMR